MSFQPQQLDWKLIDNDVTFHHLTNALLLDELGFANYIPGNPTRGADAGWDGLHRGTVRMFPELDAGLWMFQDKHTKYSGTKALGWLKRELTNPGKGKKGEIAKANEKNVTYLCVLTPAELQPAQITELQFLDRGSLSRILILSREKLEPLIARKPWVRHKFFGGPLNGSLVSHDVHRDGTDFLPLADLPFVGREHDLERVREALVGTAPVRVVLVHAPGGGGKTRLLREVGRRGNRMFPGAYVRFNEKVRPGALILSDELDPDRDHILVVDDAERDYEQDVRALARAAQLDGAQSRLLIACRTGPHTRLRSQLMLDGVSSVAELHLPPLDEQARLDLVAAHSKLDAIDRRNLVRQVGDNLFLLAYALEALRKDAAPFSFVRDQAVRDRIVEFAEDQCERTLKEHHLPYLRAFLPVVAALVPVPNNEDDVWESIAELVGADRQSLRRSVEILCTAGILRRVGATIRFGQDVIGDLVLARRLEQPDGELFLEPLTAALAEHANLIRNLVTSTMASSGTSHVLRFLERLISSWTAALPTTGVEGRREMLGRLSVIADSLPGPALRFVEQVLRAALPPDHDAEAIAQARSWGFKYSERRLMRLSTDDVGPAIERIARHADHTAGCVRLILSLGADERCAIGNSENWKPHSLLASLHNPFEVRDARVIERSLAELEGWLDRPTIGAETAEQVVGAVAAILANTFRFERHEPGVLHFGGMASPLGPRMISLRDRAVALIAKALRHPVPGARRAGAKAFGKIGQLEGISEDTPALRERAASERAALLDVLSDTVPREPSLGVTAAIDEAIFHAWLRGEEPREGLERVLRAVPRTIELRAFEWAVNRSFALDDFNAVAARAPASEPRWGWWNRDVSHRRWEDGLSEDIQLADEIAQKYDRRGDLAQLFVRLAREGLTGDRHIGWLHQLAGRHFALFDAAVTDSAALAALPDPLRQYLRHVELGRAPDPFDRAMARLPVNLFQARVEALRDILFVLEQRPDVIDPKVRVSTTLLLATHSDAQVRFALLASPRIHEALAGEDLIQLLTNALAGAAVPEVAAEALKVVRHRSAALVGADRAPLAEVLGQAIVDDRAGAWDVCYNALLLWAIGNDLGEYLGLLGQRLSAMPDTLEPTWFGRDARHARGLVPTSGELERAIDAVFVWGEAELISEHSARAFLSNLALANREAAFAYVDAHLPTTDPAVVEVIVAMLSSLRFEDASERWLRLASGVVNTDLWLEFEERLVSNAWFMTSWSRETGKPSPAHIDRLAHLKRAREARDELDPRILAGLEEAIRRLRSQLEAERRSDEEELDPW